jgi:hypothetical protein
MKIRNLILPSIVLGSAILVSTPQESHGFSLLGHSLSTNQSDFRVFNNFLDPSANDNTSTTTTFPFWGGAFQAIWKGCIEWSSDPHAGGGGDPHQAELGSGDSNFDPIFSGEATSTGNIGDNVHSALNQDGGGTFAFMQGGSFGWWCRYFENWTWNDGPGAFIGGQIDIQQVSCHEYGHSLGMGHSLNGSATMVGGSAPGTVSGRSIHADDIAGIQAIYGHRDDSGTKPLISSVTNNGGTMTIICSNLTNNSNQVWFTRLNPSSGGSSGDPIKVIGISSTNGNTQLDLNIPATAGPGDIMVKTGNAGQASTSAPYPFDPFSVPPPVPMIAALSSSTVQALTPSGGETVSILGNDFLTVTDVLVDGSPLDDGTSFSGSYTIVSDNQIDMQMPLAEAGGMVDVMVVAPGGSDTVQIDIVPSSPPAMSIEQAEIVSPLGIDLAVAAQPGDVIFLLFSPVLGPTVIPGVLDWEIGGGNLNLIFQIKGWTIGPKLWRKQHLGPFTGLTSGEMFHFEGWVLEIANGFDPPWESTNAVSRTVLL